VFVDDATSALMQARFVPSETTFACFEGLEGYLKAHGRPVAFASDKHTVFRIARRDTRSGHSMTQFRRAREAAGRDPVRQLEPSQAPRRARQPHPAGPPREGNAPGKKI
jgi:hypothetical protein